MDVRQVIVQHFLQEILFCIENIDGGCKDCITGFCDSVNEVLKEYNLELRYTDSRPVKVSVTELVTTY